MNPGWSIKHISTRQLVEELARRNDLGVNKISGRYTRTSPSGTRKLRFNWWICINDIGECRLSTDDALTDCYTSDKAYCSDSIADCLNKISEIIKEASEK